jgi:hypothetical protein
MVLHLLRGRVLLVDLLLRGRFLDLLFGGVLQIHVHERLLHLQCAGGLRVSLDARSWKFVSARCRMGK